MGISTSTTERVSTDWDYLQRLTDAFSALLNSAVYYSKNLRKNELATLHPREMRLTKKEFCAKLYGFYIMCSFKFGEYLNSGKFADDFPLEFDKVKSVEYENLFIEEPTDAKLYQLLRIIAYWQQKYGAFRTMTTVFDPGQAIKGRGA